MASPDLNKITFIYYLLFIILIGKNLSDLINCLLENFSLNKIL